MKTILLLSLILLISCQIQIKGIDLSTWDDVVYWNTLKSEVKFVILRAGYGRDNTDNLFEGYYKKCKEYNIPVGAYWYGKAQNVEEAEIEAKSFLKRLKGKQFEYPVYYDIEDKLMINTGKTTVSNMLEKFCSILEDNKYYCGVYACKSNLENYFTKRVLEKYDIWLAHYKDSTSYKGHTMWQYTDTGTLKGKPGNCDLNLCYYNYPPLIKSKHFNGY